MNVQRAITQSYLELAAQHPDAPTVAQVIIAAGVDQAAFVAQFDDLEDVALLALEEMLWTLQGSNMPRRLDEGNLGPDAAQSICDDIVARVTDAWKPMSVGVRYHRAAVQHAIGRAVQQRASAYFEAYPGFRQLDHDFLDAAAQYVGHGLAAIVTAWVAGELTAEPPVVAKQMTTLLPGWLADPQQIEAGEPT